MRREDINLETLADYRRLALKTFNPKKVKLEDSIHCTLGMASELLEFETASGAKNQLEELGDFGWYLSVYSYVHSINVGHIFLNASRTNWSLTDMHKLKKALCELVSMDKAEFVYNRTINEDMRVIQFYAAVDAWENLCWGHGLKPAVVLRENILKLQGSEGGRFANGYSDEAANNRDLNKEDQAYGHDTEGED